MSKHLPECPVIALLIKGNSVAAGSCICSKLRACEQRVLDAAREAVAALPEYRMRDTCVAAIDELREEKK